MRWLNKYTVTSWYKGGTINTSEPVHGFRSSWKISRCPHCFIIKWCVSSKVLFWTNTTEYFHDWYGSKEKITMGKICRWHNDGVLNKDKPKKFILAVWSTNIHTAWNGLSRKARCPVDISWLKLVAFLVSMPQANTKHASLLTSTNYPINKHNLLLTHLSEWALTFTWTFAQNYSCDWKLRATPLELAFLSAIGYLLCPVWHLKPRAISLRVYLANSHFIITSWAICYKFLEISLSQDEPWHQHVLHTTISDSDVSVWWTVC